MELEARVYQAKTDEAKLNALLEEYIPFINSVAAAVTKRFVDCSSDEASIAMLAFCEAIHKFDEKKGSFLVFARQVIKNRLVDYIRKQKNNPSTVALEPLENQLFKDFDNPLELEIDALDGELSKYQIHFSELSQCSPKTFHTKAFCRQCVTFLLQSEKLTAQMKHSGLLPVAEIEKNCRVSRKKIARLRKYIITVVEILTGDYPYLCDYIPYAKELKK